MLGMYTFATVPSQPLNNPTRLRNALNNYSFVSSVGGVAFDSTAIPEDAIEKISVDYNPKKPDGQRLSLVINNQSVTAKIADWQLIPIANYANTEYYSVFTLFGSLSSLDSEIIPIIPQNKEAWTKMSYSQRQIAIKEDLAAMSDDQRQIAMGVLGKKFMKQITPTLLIK